MAKKNKRKLASEINVVPYIDVMLVLLVIFMVTAPLLTQGVKVELPVAGAEPVDRRGRDPQLVRGCGPELGPRPSLQPEGGRRSDREVGCGEHGDNGLSAGRSGQAGLEKTQGYSRKAGLSV